MKSTPISATGVSSIDPAGAAASITCMWPPEPVSRPFARSTSRPILADHCQPPDGTQVVDRTKRRFLQLADFVAEVALEVGRRAFLFERDGAGSKGRNAMAQRERARREWRG